MVLLDPKTLGRCKIFVYGVFPEEFRANYAKLPWAEPVMSLFGGNWTNENDGLNKETGVSSAPHQSETPGDGAQVWVFFENGSQNNPRYFGACQSGAGWLSEHNNQHVIKTDNVRVRIDENPEHADSTATFPSYNSNCTSDGKEVVDVPTRVDIEILGNVTVNIVGNVNMKIEGDYYEEHTGDKYETLEGNLRASCLKASRW